MSVARRPKPIATGFDSPEGPAFAENGDLFFVNWLTSSINRLDSAGVVRERAILAIHCGESRDSFYERIIRC